MSSVEQLVIIGSGPAAWTAAIYAARARLTPVVLEGEPSRTMVPGGQLMTTTDVENYPGFASGVTGPELVLEMQAQAERFGARSVAAQVERVDFTHRPFTLFLSTGTDVQAHAVIVATGANARWLGIPNEERLALSGGGVSACAVCDGALPVYRDQVVAVVGGGDAAMEDALYLSRFAREVLVIHRRDQFRASRVMVERVLSHPKIRVLWNTRVTAVDGEEVIEGLRLENTVIGDPERVALGGLFVAIGHTPNTGFLSGQLALTRSGYVKTEGWRTATNVVGVFAAGDVMDEFYRQAITAAGTGAMAALEAERWLSSEGLDGDAGVSEPRTGAAAHAA